MKAFMQRHAPCAGKRSRASEAGKTSPHALNEHWPAGTFGSPHTWFELGLGLGLGFGFGFGLGLGIGSP